MFDSCPSWYALFVLSRQEEKVKQILDRQVGPQFQYIIPKRRLRERKGGRWHFVERKLFPGYILINGILTVDAYYKIKRIPDIIRFLRDEKDVLKLEEKELKLLNVLINKEDQTVGISTLYKEGDKITVIEGPLVGLEGQIVSVNHRKGRAKVKLSLANREKVVELGVELVQTPGKIRTENSQV